MTEEKAPYETDNDVSDAMEMLGAGYEISNGFICEICGTLIGQTETCLIGRNEEEKLTFICMTHERDVYDIQKILRDAMDKHGIPTDADKESEQKFFSSVTEKILKRMKFEKLVTK